MKTAPARLSDEERPAGNQDVTDTGATAGKNVGSIGRAGALVITACAYVPALLAMATIGVVVPFLNPIGEALSASRAELGFAIALFSLPTAVLATIGGGLVDKYGVRRSILFSTVMLTIGSGLASTANSLLALNVALLVGGVGFGGICIATPCLIVATLKDGARTRAISFWSTFAPTGYAAGLLLAIPFTSHASWHAPLRLHAVLLTLTLLVLARYVPRQGTATQQLQESFLQLARRTFRVVREPNVLRLGVAVALPNGLSYGTSLAAPLYLARVHELNIATSSAAVASAKIAALLIGSVSIGYLLSRAVSTTLLFRVMVGIGLVAQVVLFLPASSMLVATGALVLWLFAFGGMAGGAMSLLPAVVSDPSRVGAASGLVNQCISAASFAAPALWLSMQDASHFMLLAAICLSCSLAALPRPGSTVPTRAEPAPR